MPTAGIYNILIVDDSVTTITYLKFSFAKRLQFKLDTLNTAEDALVYLTTNTAPDLILLDISLPYMNGIELCKRLKDEYPSIPVLVMTAELDPRERLNAYQAGADDFIVKPFGIEEIVSRIKHHLHLTSLDNQGF